MITIISASNREGNLTSFFAKKCEEILSQRKIENQIFYLHDLPDTISLNSVYNYEDSIFKKLGEKLIAPATKLLFIVPEYNGSIPGILKLFLDGIEPIVFKGKKAALVGVAAGRAGNLRGMDHLTDIMHHLEVNVMPQKLPISQLFGLLKNEEVVDEATLDLISKQLKLLEEF
jgi:NAD(P)H-dependent FMN reductase